MTPGFSPCPEVRRLLPAVLLTICVATTMAMGARAAEPSPTVSASPPGHVELEYYNPGRLYAISPPNIFYHDIGEIELLTTNVGLFGNPGFVDGYACGWRGGEYLYAAGLWIGAIPSDDQPHVSTGLYEVELRPSLDPVDNVYVSYEGFPGGNRLGFSDDADDDHDGAFDEESHNGKDEDGDGAIDEDFGAISEQMFSCEYWDYTEEAQDAYPDHRPLNLFVRERSFAWSIPELDDGVGFEYRITNVGDEVLRDLHVGLFVDADLGSRDEGGYYADDGAAFLDHETTLVDPTIPGCRELPVRLQMGYMFDFPGGPDDVPGFAGLVLLAHTSDPTGRHAPQSVGVKTCRIWSGSGNEEPVNDAERYATMSSGDIPSGPTLEPDDYRYYIGTDAFPEIHPGETIVLTMAYVIGEGYWDPETGLPHPELGADGQPSEQSLLANALRFRLAYEGRWKDLDGNAATGVDGRETCIAIEDEPPFAWVSPCEGIPSITFAESQCSDATSWVDNDCNPCTPNDYHEGCEAGGCETLLPWYVPPVQRATQPATVASAGTDAPRIRLLGNPATAPIGLRVDSVARAVEVRIYDVGGRAVRSLRAPAGQQSLSWDGRDDRGAMVPGGLYFVRLTGESSTGAQKVLLLER